MSSENRPLAIVLVLLATMIFAIADSVAKVLVAELPPIQVSWLRSVVVCAVTLPIAWYRVGKRAFVTAHAGGQALRGCAVMASSLLYLVGLSYLPLAEMSAINFIWPILATVLSIPLLGEKVGLRRWLATLVGFGGMLLIIRPGSGTFQLAAIYPLAAALFWALASLMTRGMMTSEPPETTIVWTAIVMLIGTTFMLPFVWIWPSWSALGLGVIIGLGSASGHALVVFAYQRAAVSTVAPFAYVQLVWATILGYVFFSNVPDRWVFAGALLIMLSGLYTAHRERVRARLERG